MINELSNTQARFSKEISKNTKWAFLLSIVLHLTLTLTIFTIGHFELMPGQFDQQGVGTFASDSVSHMRETRLLVGDLTAEGISTWIQRSTDSHVKIYSLSFVLLEPLFGFTILSAELVNLSCYLITLFLIYALSKEFFNPKSGLLAAIIVALWPSFLLHTTQLLKTPLSVAGILTVVLVNVRWFTRDHTPKNGFLHAGLGTIAAIALWFIRSDWWPLMIILLVLGPLGAAIKMIVERRLKIWNLTASMLMLVLALSIPHFLTPPPPPAPPSTAPPPPKEPEMNFFMEIWTTALDKGNSAILKIGKLRTSFITSYPEAGSNIDTHYRISDFNGLVQYLPRATVIGLFAPFPNMWFESGEKLGLSARTLSGLETILMYAVQLMAVLSLWRIRQRFDAWYLVSAIFAGVVVLGIIVVNIGILYRFRYAFWMLLIILGAGGFQEVAWPYLKSRKIVFWSKSAWKTWKHIGQLIGDFLARVVLSLFYFTVIVPFGVGMRLFGDPLGIKRKKHPSLWIERTPQDVSLENSRRQF